MLLSMVSQPKLPAFHSSFSCFGSFVLCLSFLGLHLDNRQLDSVKACAWVQSDFILLLCVD